MSLNIDKVVIRHAKVEDYKELGTLTKLSGRERLVFNSSLALTPTNFFTFFSGKRLFVVEYKNKQGKGNEYIGYTWLEAFKSATAEIHFCSFPGLKREDLLKVGRKTLKFIFDYFSSGYFQLMSVYGLIPISNERAYCFINDLGFDHRGFIKDASYCVNGEGEKILQDTNIVNLTKREVDKWETPR